MEALAGLVDVEAVDNMAIVPGSVIVLDNNAVSLASYIVEYEE